MKYQNIASCNFSGFSWKPVSIRSDQRERGYNRTFSSFVTDDPLILSVEAILLKLFRINNRLKSFFYYIYNLYYILNVLDNFIRNNQFPYNTSELFGSWKQAIITDNSSQGQCGFCSPNHFRIS